MGFQVREVEFKKVKRMTKGKDRFVVVEKGTDKILDGSNGHGYKTIEAARKSWWFRIRGVKGQTYGLQ